jgi:hypothetical protein
LNTRSLVDLTLAPRSAPDVVGDPITGGFWLTWRDTHMRIDVLLLDKDALRDLVRNALEAAGKAEHEATHAQPSSG